MNNNYSKYFKAQKRGVYKYIKNAKKDICIFVCKCT